MGIHNLCLTSAVALSFAWESALQPIVLLYISPETVMPLASALAAIVGVLLIFGRHIAGFFKKSFRLISNKVTKASTSDSVYTNSQDETGNEGQG